MKERMIKHHRRASEDSRMLLLKEQHGYAGIGVYWEIVERIMTWGDGQYPRKELVKAIRSPQAPKKLINSVLDDFFLFDRNDYNDVVLNWIPVGECLDVDLDQLRRSLRRQKEEEEERRRAFEMRQKWLPLEEQESQNLNPP